MFLVVVLVLGSAALVMTIANGGSRGRGREILVMINGRGPNCGHGPWYAQGLKRWHRRGILALINGHGPGRGRNPGGEVMVMVVVVDGESWP